MRMRDIASKLLALGFGVAFLLAASHYPFHDTWLAPILLIYAGLLGWRPQLCLFALPVLLPVLDLAPWTGWFFIEEMDLLLLLTAAFVYWKMDVFKPSARLPACAWACIAVITLAYLIGIWRGLLPLPALDANSFADYLSPYNSLRIGKSWFWAIVLLPILLCCAGRDLVNIERYFIPGMLSGLALVSCAAIWERWLFPGLMNFSSDYRTTAPFSSMHTGGAALDGYLALSFPLLAIWLLARSSRLKVAAAIGLLAAGGYAGLSTFSRGLYAAYACSTAIIATYLTYPLLVALKLKNTPWGNMRRLAGAIGAMLLIMYALFNVFSSAGYRGFAAALAVLLAAAIVATRRIPWKLWPTTLLCSIAIEVSLGSLLSLNQSAGGMLKPPYLLFMVSALAFVGALAAPRNRLFVLLIAFWCLALSALWVGSHWGGMAALRPGALVVAIAVGLIAVNTVARTPLWRIDRTSLTLASAMAILLALMIPFSASYYAVERFSTTRSDLEGRVRHWTQVLDIMDGDQLTQAFGMGLGKFPVTYRWRNLQRELPGSISYLDEINNRYLRHFAPQYPAGYGEVLRLLQRLPIRANTWYVLAFDVRRPDDRSWLNISICERMLLYPKNCVHAPLGVLPPGANWQHHTLRLDSAHLGAGNWLARAPTQLEVAVGGGPTFVDIDNISVREENSGVELIRNGAFEDGNDGWFFSSDRHHLPWHAKNLALNLYFELGWLGVLSFFSLLLYAIAHLLAQAGHAGIRATAYLAALAGFQVVGLFDSLLDVPRIALLFYLVLFVALMLPSNAPPHPSRK